MKLKNLELHYVLLGGGWYSFSLKSKAAKCPKSIDPSSSSDGFRSSSISLSSNGWPLGIFIVFIPAQASSRDSLPLLSVSISSNFCIISAALLKRGNCLNKPRIQLPVVPGIQTHETLQKQLELFLGNMKLLATFCDTLGEITCVLYTLKIKKQQLISKLYFQYFILIFYIKHKR